MIAANWLLLSAACGHLALGLVAVLRGGRSALAVPLALLCFDLFAVSLTTLGLRVDESTAWLLADGVFTSLGPGIALHFVLAFTGRLKKQRWLVIAAYAACALLAGSAVYRVGLPSEDPSLGAWSVAFLALWIPLLAHQLTLLVLHLRRSTDADERARASLVLFAFLLGGTFAATDVWNDIDPSVPSLGPLGMLVGTSLVTLAALRFELFEGKPLRKQLALAGVVALTAVFLQLGALRSFGGAWSLVVFGTALFSLLLVLGLRELARSREDDKRRLQQHAVLGRFAAQMAHDLKNPLAALIGAAQFLEVKLRERGGDETRLSELLLDQARRVHGIIESYERLARVEPLPSLVDLNALVQKLGTLQDFAKSPAIELELVLAQDLPRIQADPDLIQTSLDNLLRNSLEAMQGEGRLRIETFASARDDGNWVTLRVRDTGRGMSARDLERAFDDFFTTKASGSGLGLGFVRRVVLAHRGTIALDSKLGQGTSVDLGFLAHTPT